MNPILLSSLIGFAFFVQTTTGFGSALIAMPLLAEALGAPTAAPTFALLACVVQVILLVIYRQSVNRGMVARLAAASAVGIPLGIVALKQADERLLFTTLGLIVAGYGVYGLLRLRLPEIRDTRWAYGAGFLSGLLSGAYNVGGPPLIIYGNCLRWQPDEFKSNLQGIFQFNTVVILMMHAAAHNLTSQVWEGFFTAMPGLLAGLILGLLLNRYINPALFTQIVLALLVVLGLNLIF